MARVIVELVPNTLILKSSTSDDGTTKSSISGFALINEFDIDCPEEKTLGIDLNDYINSWCGVRFEVYGSEIKLGKHDLPDTRAKLYHHGDPDADVMDKHSGGGFTLDVSLDQTEYERIIATTRDPKLRLILECSAWFKHSTEEKTIFGNGIGTWYARFESIELSFGVTHERWPLTGLVGRKLNEFEKSIPKEHRKNNFELSYYLAKSVGRWAANAPVSRKSVSEELDEAFEIVRNIMNRAVQEYVGSDIDLYLKKPWATSGDFEYKLIQTLVNERINELLLEIQRPQNTREVAALRSYYRIVDTPQTPKYGAAPEVLGSITASIGLGILVGMSFGWTIGVFAGFVYASIREIKGTIERVGLPKPGFALAALSRDLEHTKSMFWRSDTKSICPRYIRERLEEMDNRGVGWYAGTLDIVHHAEARNPNIWE